jgi:hypothetical protein
MRYSTQNKTLTVFLSEILDTKQDTYWFFIWDTTVPTQNKTLTCFLSEILLSQHKTRHLLVFYLRYYCLNTKQDTYCFFIWDTTVSRDSFSAVRIFIFSLDLCDSSVCCCCNFLCCSLCSSFILRGKKQTISNILMHCLDKWTLEKTKGTIKNDNSETLVGNIDHTRHMTKTNKTQHNTENY